MNRWFWIILASAILVGVLYAAPQFLIRADVQKGGGDFVLKQLVTMDDEGYFYLQNAREVYDGHFPPKDFFLDRKDQRPSILNPIPPAIFSAFIFIAQGNINDAYLIANFALPAALFLLFYALGYAAFNRNRLWAIFLAFVGVFTAMALNTPRVFFGIDNFLNIFVKNFYPGVTTLLEKLFLSRIDYPLTTHLVYLPAIILFFVFWKKPRWWNAALAGAFSGLLFYTYFHIWAYWVIVIGLLFAYTLIRLRNDTLLIKNFTLLIAIVVISAIPMITNQLQFRIADVTGEFALRMGHLIEYGRSVRWEAWPHYLFYVLLGGALYLLRNRFEKKHLALFGAFIAAGAIAWQAHLLTGFVPVWRHWHRAISPPLFLIVFSVVYHLEQKAEMRWGGARKAIGTLLIVSIALLGVKKVVNALHFISPPSDVIEQYTMPADIVASWRWIEENLPREPRIISPSFITSIHLSAQTSARPFLPWSVIPTFTNFEIEERYLAANKALNVSAATLKKRLESDEDHQNLYNFYFKDQGLERIPDSKVKELIQRYQTMDLERDRIAADYIYYGPLERNLSDEDFSGKKDLEIVYQNQSVEIYKIKRL
jgi:hypothetical protein